MTSASKRFLVGVAAFAAAFPLIALAAPLEIPNAFEDGDVISAEAFNENFDAIAAAFDENDARIAALEDELGDRGVPSGTVAYFAVDACPAGWTEHTDLRGRVAVGLPEDGTLSATVGTALADEGTRAITEVPSHAHDVGTLAATASTVGPHTHDIDDDGSHDHAIAVSSGSSTTSAVHGAPGTGTTLTRVPMSNDGTHDHSMQSAGGHSHTVTISGSTASTGLAAVDVTMPYQQLLACRKE